MKNGPLTGLLAVLVLVLLVLAVWIFLDGHSLFRKPDLGERELGFMDSLLDSREYSKLSRTALGYARFCDTETEWRSLLKRGLAVFGRSGDPSLFRDLSLAAAKSLPGNTTINAFACKAMLLSGDIAGAYAMLPLSADQDLWKALEAETAYRLMASARETRGGFALLTRAMAAAAARSADPAMYVNSGLLAMRQGETGEAKAAFLRAAMAGGDVSYREAWDSGAYELELILAAGKSGDTETPERLSEALVALKRHAEAEEILKRFVSANPGVSYRAWLNLSVLSGNDGPAEKYYLDRAKDLFPKVPEVIRAFASRLSREGEHEAALAEIRRYGEFKNEPSLALEYVLSESALSSADRFRGMAISHLSAFPDDVESHMKLLPGLLGMGYWADAVNAYDSFALRRPEACAEWPFPYYKALSALARGEAETAANVLETECAVFDSAEAPFALGLLSASDKKSAYDWFSLAETKTGNPVLKASCFKEMGKISLSWEKTGEAAALFAKAKDLNPRDKELDLLFGEATE